MHLSQKPHILLFELSNIIMKSLVQRKHENMYIVLRIIFLVQCF